MVRFFITGRLLETVGHDGAAGGIGRLLPPATGNCSSSFRWPRSLRWSRFVGQFEGENKVYSDWVDALDEGNLPPAADDVNGLVEAPAVVV